MTIYPATSCNKKLITVLQPDTYPRGTIKFGMGCSNSGEGCITGLRRGGLGAGKGG
jgi:hypothetical protein